MAYIHRAVFRGRLVPWLYLLPTICVLVVFIYYPALKSIVLSLYRSNFFLGTRKFIGLENFKNLLSGPVAPGFRQVFIQTILFSSCVVFFGIVMGLFLSIQANKKIHGARIYRLLLIWPFALSPAVAGTIYTFMFNPEVGIVNEFLHAVFRIEPAWLSSPISAFFVTAGAAVWKNLGYNIVFYLAALQSVPKEPLEAADIDGAGGWLKFRHVLVPLLSPTTFFLLFTNLTYSFFDSFGIIDVLTKGAPVGRFPFDNAGVTTTLMYKVFLDGFGGSSNMGFAAAESVILMILAAVVLGLQFGLFGKKVNYDT
ncbi:MAG: sugar ABC transporter permease [Treponema sp.]|jgi:sn-glycerol 3-phosphate transport system permease protein|nr:sugar ABC transporter permease [Treponema sp.]